MGLNWGRNPGKGKICGFEETKKLDSTGLGLLNVGMVWQAADCLSNIYSVLLTNANSVLFRAAVCTVTAHRPSGPVVTGTGRLVV